MKWCIAAMTISFLILSSLPYIIICCAHLTLETIIIFENLLETESLQVN